MYTPEQFEQFVDLPENDELLFEFIAGEIVEKTPTNFYASVIASRMIHFLMSWIDKQGISGGMTGEGGGYKIGDERYVPDAAYIPTTDLAKKGYHPTPPTLAVEVETNTTAETERRLRQKISHYLHAGVVVWVVYPETQEVEVHVPGAAILRLTINDELDGGDILPGFKLAIKRIFI